MAEEPSEEANSINVNGLRLPAALVEAIEGGDWAGRKNRSVIEHALRLDAPDPRFYSLDAIAGVNREWRAEDRDVYVGVPDSVNPPGDIDPTQSLLIGDLQTDAMIALDYRATSEEPRVVCCYLGPPSPWIVIASSTEELIRRLRAATEAGNGHA